MHFVRLVKTNYRAVIRAPVYFQSHEQIIVQLDQGTEPFAFVLRPLRILACTFLKVVEEVAPTSLIYCRSEIIRDGRTIRIAHFSMTLSLSLLCL